MYPLKTGTIAFQQYVLYSCVCVCESHWVNSSISIWIFAVHATFVCGSLLTEKYIYIVVLRKIDNLQAFCNIETHQICSLVQPSVCSNIWTIATTLICSKVFNMMCIDGVNFSRWNFQWLGLFAGSLWFSITSKWEISKWNVFLRTSMYACIFILGKHVENVLPQLNIAVAGWNARALLWLCAFGKYSSWLLWW